MKKIVILIFALLLNAQMPNVELPLQNNTSQNLTVSDTNNSLDNTKITYTPEIIETDLNESYVSFNSKVNFAIVIDKQKFFKYLPSLINSINAYLAQKGIDYNLTVYNSDIDFEKIKNPDIIYFTTDINELKKLKEINKTFYLPLIHKNETNITSKNIYFGSIDFKKQIESLTEFINDKTYVIADNTQISKKLLSYESNIKNLKSVFKFPNIYYRSLNNAFIIFNTPAGKTAQVLSMITQKQIQTKLTLTPQIGYDPLLITLTQPADIKKLIIANSIINPPNIINEYANILNSDIRYNWLNFSVCILTNKIYNRQNEEDEFYMSDFNIYIFDNQIDYKTELYRIIDGAFKEVE